MSELYKNVEKMLLSGKKIKDVFKTLNQKGYSDSQIFEAVKKCEKKHIRNSKNELE